MMIQRSPLFSVCLAFSSALCGCAGTETGNPIIDTKKIELINDGENYRITGAEGAVSEDSEIIATDVWGKSDPQQIQVLASQPFSLSLPITDESSNFRVYAQNEFGRSSAIRLGERDAHVCFIYMGSDELEVGTLEPTQGGTTITTVVVRNICGSSTEAPGAEFRFATAGLSFESSATVDGDEAEIVYRIIADDTIADFDDILLIGVDSTPIDKVASVGFWGDIAR